MMIEQHRERQSSGKISFLLPIFFQASFDTPINYFNKNVCANTKRVRRTLEKDKITYSNK